MAHDASSEWRPSAGRFVALVWLGMLIGVSFIATPVKFQAPSLSLPVALLEVGSMTFALFSRVEWAAAALLVVLLLPKSDRLLAALVLAAAATVVLESAWLLPILDARVEAIIEGRPLPPSADHLIYAAIEAGKAVLLCGIALLLSWKRVPMQPDVRPDRPWCVTRATPLQASSTGTACRSWRSRAHPWQESSTP